MESVQSELIEIIKSSKQFVLDQAPEVLKQLVLIAKVETVVEFLIFPILIYACVKLWKITIKKIDEGHWEDILYTAPAALSVLSLFYGVFLFTIGIHTAITVFFAPKVYLLEHLSEMASGK